MLKAPPAKRLTRNLGNTRRYRDPKKAKAPSLPKDEVIPDGGLTILDIRHEQCKWPTGNNEYGEVIFCGREKLKGKHKGENISAKNPYCTAHYRLGLDKYRPRRRDGDDGDTKEDIVRPAGKGS